MKIKNAILATSIITTGFFSGIPIIVEGQEGASDPTDHQGGGIHNPSTIKAEIVPFPPYHAAGNDVPTILRLTDAQGKPVKWEDLETAHTRRIHLLIIDESMTDFYHDLPEPTDKPGEFRFIFKPKYGGRYHVWTDLLPKSTGKQEYSKAEIQVDGRPKPLSETLNTTAMVDGYKFDLSIENKRGFKLGRPATLIVKITKPDGLPANNLEPIMGAFAHGVGFPYDLDSVMQVTSAGKEPEKDSDHGGPELKFNIIPEKTGWLKFYVQVRIDGYSKFAGFGLKVL